MKYVAPIEEMLFIIENVCDVKSLNKFSKYAHLDITTIRTILEEIGKLSTNKIEPVNRPSDLSPPKLENDKVICSPGFVEAYKAIADGGWVGSSANSKFGGMDLPMVITSCVNEILGSACLSLSLNPLMTQGQIEALEAYGSADIQNTYLPNLTSGRWSGTMNLTEECAGSDVGALRTKAIPNDDGTFDISGQKIYISWGEHDLTENICHLVLARLPNSKRGTAGISLFLVPKFIPCGNKGIGKRNNVTALSIEKKMGLHGSPTAVMEYKNAKGWIIGEPNGGMAAMFTMMNNARLGVGVQGVSQAERAIQKATFFAKSRKQGKAIVKNGTGSILDHADVRRNMLIMKALTFIARCICLETAVSTDFSKVSGSKDYQAKAAFLTPIAKAFGTDIGCQVTDLGIQVHGGLGFIENAGASQLYRDVRITRIYEGTNGIQAMDLVNRKLSDGGRAAFKIIDDFMNVEKACLNSNLFEKDAIKDFKASCSDLTDAVNWMLKVDDINDRYAGATAFLRAFSLVLGGYYLLRCANISRDPDRVALAHFYIYHLLPEVHAEVKSACRGSQALYCVKI